MANFHNLKILTYEEIWYVCTNDTYSNGGKFSQSQDSGIQINITCMYRHIIK